MIALLPAFLIGLITSAFSCLENAAWWQMLSLACFWVFLDKKNFQAAKKQAVLGWAFGFGYFSLGLCWLYISLHDIGGMHALMAIGGVLALSAFLALFTSFAVCLGTRFHDRTFSALAWASAWTLSEWLRTHILTGFPWIGYGDTQVNGPFSGLIPIFGALGGTFAALWAAQKIASSPRKLFLPLISVGFAILGSSLLKNIEFTQPIGKMLEVRLVQGNFEQSMFFNPLLIKRQIDFYEHALTSKSADLIVTPETAFPLPKDRLDPDLDRRIQQFSTQSNTHILTGSIGEVDGQYSNRATGYSPLASSYTYDKEHLVPFGEYIPKGFNWFVEAINAPLSNFAIGSKNQPDFPIIRENQPNLYAAITICYEDVFGDELASRLRNLKTDTNLLINMTNLAWFGDSQAPDQQLRLSRLRSLETGLPSIRATNTGATAIVNYKGEIIQRLPGFKQDSLIGSVQARTGKTPFVEWGDFPILLISLMILLSSTLRLRQTFYRA